MGAFCTFTIETKHMKCIRFEDGFGGFGLKIAKRMNKDELDMESLLGYGLEMLVESGKYDVRER